MKTGYSTNFLIRLCMVKWLNGWLFYLRKHVRLYVNNKETDVRLWVLSEGLVNEDKSLSKGQRMHLVSNPGTSNYETTMTALPLSHRAPSNYDSSVLMNKGDIILLSVYLHNNRKGYS